MSAVRQVVLRYEMELAVTEKLTASFPESLLERESAVEQRKIERLWHSFCESANDLLKTRRNRMVNKYIRKAVFQSGMENLCSSFNRSLQHVKLSFRQGDASLYKLEIVSLSAIPESCQPSGQWFVAEIPRLEYEAQATLVGLVPLPVTNSDSTDSNNAPMATASSIEQEEGDAAPFAQIIPLLSTSMAPIQAVAVAERRQPNINSILSSSSSSTLPVARVQVID